MNPLCECPKSGFCTRHQVMKGAELHKRCQTRIGYWIMWEQGRGGATAPLHPVFDPPGFIEEKQQQVKYKSSVGDKLSEIIRRETGHEIPCSACLDDINELNSMEVHDCIARRETMIDDIYSRSYENASVIQKIGIAVDKLLTGSRITKMIIGGWFDEAVENGITPKQQVIAASMQSKSCKGC